MQPKQEPLATRKEGGGGRRWKRPFLSMEDSATTGFLPGPVGCIHAEPLWFQGRGKRETILCGQRWLEPWRRLTEPPRIP
jgi:hypothetical protein